MKRADASTVIDLLKLEPHPEGGWYRETWRGAQRPRAAGSAIYFLLEAHQSSHIHSQRSEPRERTGQYPNDAVVVWRDLGG